MATLTTQRVVEAGLEASYSAAAAGGDTFVNDTAGRTFLHVKNGGGSDITVTIAAVRSNVSSGTYGPLTKEDISVSVTAGEDRFIGPVKVAAYGNNPDIQYSDVTSVTLAVLKN